MIDVWLVRVPTSVTKATAGSRTIPAVSAGERSRAMTIIGCSSCGIAVCASPASARRRRSLTNLMSWRRSTMYESPPLGSSGPKSPAISSLAPATAHSAFFRSSRIFRSTSSWSIGSLSMRRYASRIGALSRPGPVVLRREATSIRLCLAPATAC